MDKIKCIIVDDEPVAQRIIERYVNDLPELELIAVCLHALEAREVLQHRDVDLMFLDLEMPKLKGFAFMKTLSNSPAVIITTAHREYALEGYELQVVDYLLKPITFERFLKAVDRYKQLSRNNTGPASSSVKTSTTIDVKSERKTVRLNKKEIRYLEGMNNYIRIHTTDKSLTVYTSLQRIIEKLGPEFIRIHKSYIVNKHHLTAFSKEHVEIGNLTLPVGLSYRKVVNQL